MLRLVALLVLLARGGASCTIEPSVEGVSCLTTRVVEQDTRNPDYTAALSVDEKAGQVHIACKPASTQSSPAFTYTTTHVDPQIEYAFMRATEELQKLHKDPNSPISKFAKIYIRGTKYYYDNGRAAGVCARVARKAVTHVKQDSVEPKIVAPIDSDVDCMSQPDGSKRCSKKHSLREGCGYEFFFAIGANEEFRPVENLLKDLRCVNDAKQFGGNPLGFTADMIISEDGDSVEIECRAGDGWEFMYTVSPDGEGKAVVSELKQLVEGETIHTDAISEYLEKKKRIAVALCAAAGNTAQTVNRDLHAALGRIGAQDSRVSPIESEWNVELSNSQQCVEVHRSSGFAVLFCPGRQLLVRRGPDCDFALSGTFSKVDYSLDSESVSQVKAIVTAHRSVFESCPVEVQCESRTCAYESRLSQSNPNELACIRKGFGRELMGIMVFPAGGSLDTCGGLVQKFSDVQKAFVIPVRIYKHPTDGAEVRVTESEVIVTSSDGKCETHFRKLSKHMRPWISALHELTFDDEGRVIRDDDTGGKLTQLLETIVTKWNYNTCLDPDADNSNGELREGWRGTATPIKKVLYLELVGQADVFTPSGSKVTLTCHSPHDGAVFGTYTVDTAAIQGKARRPTLGRALKTLTLQQESAVSIETRTRVCAHLYSRLQEIHGGVHRIEERLKSHLSMVNRQHMEQVIQEARKRA